MKIILTGFMGSGKTAVSHKLAVILGIRQVELDELTLKISGRKSINEIFELDGEGKFRKFEQAALTSISGDFVLSAGGGTVLQKGNAKIIYLKTSFDVIIDRLKNQSDRPLFTKKAKELYDTRLASYEQLADISVLTDNLTVDDVVNEIIKSLKYAR